jgi:hypothetical protein
MKSDAAINDEIAQLEIMTRDPSRSREGKLLAQGALVALRWMAGSRRRPSTAFRRSLVELDDDQSSSEG